MATLLLSICLNTKAWQTEELDIEYITRFNGLSDNNINQIFKDRSGFIWFATNDGLNRYDGHKVKPFIIPDITLSIYDIHQTEADWLWINTNKGLMAFHLLTKTYQEFSTIDHSALKKFKSATITGMEGRTSSAILMGTSVGLFKISIETKAGEQPKLNVYDWTQRNKVTGNFLTAITQDENGVFYLGSPNHFVVQLDTTTNHVTKYDSPVKDRIGNILFDINHLQYNHGILWIATMSAGLVKLNTKTGELEAFPSATIERNNPYAMVHHDIYATGTDGDGSLWVGTWNGINRLRKDNIIPECYNLSHPLFTQMQETRIQSVLCADDQVIWIGTFGGGAIKIELNKAFFRRVPMDSEYEVKGITQDAQGRIWLATFHGGIRHSTEAPDPDKPLTFTPIKALKRPDNQEPISNFLCAFTDDHKNLWFGSENSSLIRINRSSKEPHITVIKPVNGPHFNGRIETIEATNDNELLLGTSEGLIVTNRANGQSRYIYFSNASLNKLHIRSFCRLSKDSLAMGSYHGTFIIPTNQLTERTPIIAVGQEQTSNTEKLQDTWALAKDSNNNLWIGFRGGLGKTTLPDSPLKTFTTREGLCDNFITAMGFDHHNTLWIATNSGITKFDPRSYTSENHYIANNNRSLFIDRDKNILVGNNNGILLFNPDNRPKNIAKIHPLIANIQINNTTINNYGGDTPHQTLHLKYPENNITIELTSSSHKQVHLQKFTYQLTGIDKHPITVDTKGSTIAYKQLPPGKYLFSFNVTAADGTTGENPMQLEIVVLPPWWQTTWAIALFALMAVGLIVAFWRIRYRQMVNKQNEVLYRNKMKHQLELERMEKKNQLQLIETKSRFFINITHELLTPLTLITTPINDILARQRDMDGALYKRLQSVGDNATRLSLLIKQVLDFRKLETGNLSPHPEPIDLAIALQRFHQQFMPLATSKNMAFSLSVPVGNLTILADPQMLETIVTNLLSNAFKYTPEKGEIGIIASADHPDRPEWAIIEIRDNGQGISNEEQKYVFEQFFRTTNQQKSSSTGTGIGLALAKELTELLSGEIWLESTPNQGSSFFVKLPLNQTPMAGEMPQRQPGGAMTQMEPMPANEAQDSDRILIVEDHAELRSYLAEILSNYKVLQASNGQEAILLAQNEQPELIISDVMMPVMDGLELTQRIKEDESTCHIPVILLTARIADQEQIEGLEQGADDYVTKPFNADILRIKVKKLIESRKQMKTSFNKHIILEPTEINIETHEEEFLKSAMQIVEEEMANPEFSAVALAERLHMSQPTLYRRIKTMTGQNIVDFIKSIRIKRAAQLIQTNQFSMTQISEMVGFNDPSYFRRCFSKQFGVNPSQYKTNQTNKP